MSDATWYYQQYEQRNGPVSPQAICDLLASGQLSPKAPVWCEAAKQWVPASSIPAFRAAAAKAPPELPAGPPPARPHSFQVLHQIENQEPHVSEFELTPHPWLRFFARAGDRVFWLLTPMMALIALSPRTGPAFPPMALYAACIFAWPVIEAMLLATWGTTPGKSALGIRVETTEGTKPSFSQALTRSYTVLLAGEGMGIPLIGLITQVVAFQTVSQQGSASWDSSAGLRVRHAECGAGRVVALLLLCWLYCAVLGVVSAKGSLALDAYGRHAIAAATTPAPPSPQREIVREGGVSVELVDGARRAGLVGTWQAQSLGNFAGKRVELYTTLQLNADGTYRETSRASGPTREPVGQWRGTWELYGNELFETCTFSTTPAHPTGTYRYGLAAYDRRNLNLVLAAAPAHYQGSQARHPAFEKDLSVADTR